MNNQNEPDKPDKPDKNNNQLPLQLGLTLIAAGTLVLLKNSLVLQYNDKTPLLMSFESYFILILTLLFSFLITITVKPLKKYSEPVMFLLVLSCGYAAAETIYRSFTLQVPPESNLLPINAIEHLNLFFLHRIYAIIPITAALILYFKLPGHNQNGFFRVGDLKADTTLFNQKKLPTWNKALLWFASWVIIVLLFLIIYNYTKNKSLNHLHLSLIVSILLYALWNCFVEETVFRNLLLKAFSTSIKPEQANIAQAFLFGLVHIDPSGFLISFVKVALFTFLGWFFGKATLETRGIAASFIMHSMIVIAIELQIAL